METRIFSENFVNSQNLGYFGKFWKILGDFGNLENLAKNGPGRFSDVLRCA
jgi:hypothetical protein